MTYRKNISVRDTPVEGECYLVAEATERETTFWGRLLAVLRRKPQAALHDVELYYRRVVSVSPWLVVYRDDDPNAPMDMPVLKAEWRATWADFVVQCTAVAPEPLCDADLGALLGVVVFSVEVVTGSSSEGTDEVDTHAVSHTEVPMDPDDEDDWDD